MHDAWKVAFAPAFHFHDVCSRFVGKNAPAVACGSGAISLAKKGYIKKGKPKLPLHFAFDRTWVTVATCDTGKDTPPTAMLAGLGRTSRESFLAAARLEAAEDGRDTIDGGVAR